MGTRTARREAQELYPTGRVAAEPFRAGEPATRHPSMRNSGVIDEFITAAEKACGPADILVNAAGTTAEQPVSVRAVMRDGAPPPTSSTP